MILMESSLQLIMQLPQVITLLMILDENQGYISTKDVYNATLAIF